MDRQGVAAITRYISVCQGREFSHDDLTVWFDALQDLDAGIALDACKLLARETSAFITPALVRQRYGSLAQTRIAEAGRPDLPAGLSNAEYQTWLRNYRLHVARGETSVHANHLALEAAGVSEGRVLLDVNREPVALPKLTLGVVPDTGSDDAVDGEIVAE